MRESTAKIYHRIFQSPQILFVAFLLAAALISLINIQLGAHEFWGGTYTYYNNYVIFKSSFGNLIEHKNLYELHLDQYADLYKYSPSFAVLMGLFYYLPDHLGLTLWNLLNLIVLYKGLQSLSQLSIQNRNFLLLFVAAELFISVQNSQSNVLLAGACIWAFGLLEKNKTGSATLILALATFVKIYSILGALLLLLYPNRIKTIFQFTGWCLAILLLPLALIPFQELLQQYEYWWLMLKADQSASVGMSMYVFTQLMLPDSIYKIITLISGVLLLLSPLALFYQYKNPEFRLKFLCLILTWMVVFNYKAESPTFIITMSGIGIWYFCKSTPSRTDLILVLMTLFFTSVWVTDLVPRGIKDHFIPIHYIKTIMPAFMFFRILFDVWFPGRKKEKLAHENGK